MGLFVSRFRGGERGAEGGLTEGRKLQPRNDNRADMVVDCVCKGATVKTGGMSEW